MVQELIKQWNRFSNYVIETVPNYTDNDFTFNNFMEWLQNNEVEYIDGFPVVVTGD